MNVREAKTHLSKLLARAAKGEEFVITRAGRPVVRLIPMTPISQVDEILGVDKGRISIAPDFTAPLPRAIQSLFEGVAEDPARLRRRTSPRPTIRASPRCGS